MKIGKGVEWAAHTCALLALLPAGASLSGEVLAEFIDVPAPYLAKQLQSLSRAGLVSARRGVAGGYSLARIPETISLWDITAALEGSAPSFRCTEVRRNGPCAASRHECLAPCAIASAFAKAEQEYRNALDATRLPELVESIAQDSKPARLRKISTWIEENAAFAA
ncbi:MAG: Rrf2 family transcriptional regulator [Pseudomonadota bacterium]